MGTSPHPAWFAPFETGLGALRSGRLLTGLLYLLLLPLSAFAHPPEEKQLRSDLYIMF
jgi:hypothetical protein